MVPIFQLRDLVVSEEIPGECPEVFFKKTPRFSYLKPIDNFLDRFNELLIEPGSIEVKRRFSPDQHVITKINEILAANPSGPKFAARNATLYCPSWTFTLKQLIYKKITGEVIASSDSLILDKIARALGHVKILVHSFIVNPHLQKTIILLFGSILQSISRACHALKLVSSLRLVNLLPSEKTS